MKIPKNSKNKIPSFPFYPADWRGDLKLQLCKLDIKGLWVELMCIMHDSNKYGYLLIDGEKPTEEELAFLLRVDIDIFKKLFSELKEKGIIKINEEGIYYSKRMVNDFKLRELSKEYGKLGGNPNLKEGKGRGKGRGYPSSEKEKEDEIEKGIENSKKKWFDEAWGRYPEKDGKKAAFKYFTTSIKNEQDWLDINKALDNYLKSDKVKRGFVKNGSTWFNNWQDWINYKPKETFDPIKYEEELKQRIKEKENARQK